MWYASYDLSDTASILFQFGRDVQGKEFCVYAEDVQAMAQSIQADEDRYK